MKLDHPFCFLNVTSIHTIVEGFPQGMTLGWLAGSNKLYQVGYSITIHIPQAQIFIQ